MTWWQDLYRKAIEFAAVAHRNQKVPGRAFSYVVHLSNVCMEVIASLEFEPRVNANLAVVCALLHDVLEDTDTRPVDVEESFGRDVWMGVVALTKKQSLSKKKAMADSLDRILQQPREIGMVKLDDRITNLGMPPFHWTAKKTRDYHEEAKVIHSEELQQVSCRQTPDKDQEVSGMAVRTWKSRWT
jgi:guanosine-3',5'-bis(diphosphate) 3'-pyrophosphohydrolase